LAITPRTIALSARAGIAVGAGGMLLLEVSPILLACGGWGTSLLALLAFPRIRRNDLLIAVGAGGAIFGMAAAAPDMDRALLNAAAGAFGPALIALTLRVMHVRGLASANWHMSFVEWRQLDRRRRRDSRSPEQIKIKQIQIDA
jgi:hypothetical protein